MRQDNARSHSGRTASWWTDAVFLVWGHRLTQQLAAAYAKDGITVNSVAPSQIMSETLIENVPQDRIDALAASNLTGRLTEPQEVAQTIGFLTAEGTSYVSGAVININGGQL